MADIPTPFIPTPRRQDPFGAALGLRAGTLGELLEQLQTGLHADTFGELQGLLGLSQKELGERVGLSEATLHRRLADRRFKKEESERINRLFELFECATGLFEDPNKARTWLKLPAPALGGVTPLNYAARHGAGCKSGAGPHRTPRVRRVWLTLSAWWILNRRCQHEPLSGEWS